MRIFKDINYGEYKEELLDIYLPDEGSKFSVFVYFHGGGLENGSKEEAFIPGLVEKGIAVVSANYRMYMNAKYPEFIEDAAEAVAWVKNNIENYCGVKNIYVGGSSAGGYLSMMLCFDDKYLKKHNLSNADIAGYLHDAGQPTTHFNVLRERGLDTRRIIVDEASPMFFIEEGKEYPPMEFIVSDKDMQNRYEQTMLMVSTLKHFGKDMSKITLSVQKNSKHCEYVNKVDDDGNFVFASMIESFIKRLEA